MRAAGRAQGGRAAASARGLGSPPATSAPGLIGLTPYAALGRNKAAGLPPSQPSSYGFMHCTFAPDGVADRADCVFQDVQNVRTTGRTVHARAGIARPAARRACATLRACVLRLASWKTYGTRPLPHLASCMRCTVRTLHVPFGGICVLFPLTAGRVRHVPHRDEDKARRPRPRLARADRLQPVRMQARVLAPRPHRGRTRVLTADRHACDRTRWRGAGARVACTRWHWPGTGPDRPLRHVRIGPWRWTAACRAHGHRRAPNRTRGTGPAWHWPGAGGSAMALRCHRIVRAALAAVVVVVLVACPVGIPGLSAASAVAEDARE